MSIFNNKWQMPFFPNSSTPRKQALSQMQQDEYDRNLRSATTNQLELILQHVGLVTKSQYVFSDLAEVTHDPVSIHFDSRRGNLEVTINSGHYVEQPEEQIAKSFHELTTIFMQKGLVPEGNHPSFLKIMGSFKENNPLKVTCDEQDPHKSNVSLSMRSDSIMPLINAGVRDLEVLSAAATITNQSLKNLTIEFKFEKDGDQLLKSIYEIAKDIHNEIGKFIAPPSRISQVEINSKTESPKNIIIQVKEFFDPLAKALGFTKL